ncbi:hypothetical protein [Prauserella sp. PE36]|nr:hypothetical protein [Prauserella sp. PE36]
MTGSMTGPMALLAALGLVALLVVNADSGVAPRVILPRRSTTGR